MTVDDNVLQHYTEWWDAKPEFSKYETRWEKLHAMVAENDLAGVATMMRDMGIAMYKQGFALRLTGE